MTGVVCSYAMGKRYCELQDALRADVERCKPDGVQLAFTRDEREPANWREATHRKPEYIMAARDATGCDWLLYLDADARMDRWPPVAELLADMDAYTARVAAHFLTGTDRGDERGELIGSTLLFWFSPELDEGPADITLLDWYNACANDMYWTGGKTWDQLLLQDATRSREVHALPPAWCWIERTPGVDDISSRRYSYPSGGPYIRQTQASREVPREAK